MSIPPDAIRRRTVDPGIALRQRATKLVGPLDGRIGSWRSRLALFDMMVRLGRITSADGKNVADLAGAIRQDIQMLSDTVATVAPDLSQHDVVIRRADALYDLLRSAEALEERTQLLRINP